MLKTKSLRANCSFVLFCPQVLFTVEGIKETFVEDANDIELVDNTFADVVNDVRDLENPEGVTYNLTRQLSERSAIISF